jgi:hypothetical protein
MILRSFVNNPDRRTLFYIESANSGSTRVGPRQKQFSEPRTPIATIITIIKKVPVKQHAARGRRR